MEMIAMEAEQSLTRTDSFECDGPAELDLRVASGRIEVRAADAPELRVEVAVEAGEGTRLQEGFEGLLERVSTGDYEPSEADAHALRETQVTFSENRRRLVVRTPRTFRRISLAVVVDAPAGSRLTAVTHRGPITSTGALGAFSVA
jgi:hypothetical protein